MNLNYKFLIYIIASFFSLLLLAFIGFLFYLQPMLKNYVVQKAASYNIQITPDKIGFDGFIELSKQQFMVNNNEIYIQKAKIRPPLPFFNGSAVIRDLQIYNANYKIIFPIVKINGLQKNKTFFAKTNKFYKYNIDNIYIPKAIVTYQNANHIELNNIKIKDFINGNIKLISLALARLDLSQSTGTLFNSQIKNLNIANIMDSWKGSNIANVKQLWQGIKINQLAFKLKNKDIILKSSNLDISKFLLNPFSTGFKNLLEQIKIDKTSGNEKKFHNNSLKIIKNINQLGMYSKNFSIHTPKFNMQLNNLNLHSSNWKAIIPYNLTIAFDNFKYSSLSDLEQKDILTPIDWQNIKFNGKIAFDYKPAAQTLALNNLDLNVNNLYKINVALTASNISTALFNLDQNAIDNLYNEITLNKLNLVYSDNKFTQSFINWLSITHNLNQKDVEQLIYAILEKSPPLLLHNQILGDLIGQKLLEAAKKPQTYTLSVVAKGRTGLKLNDILNDNIKDLTPLTQKIDWHITNKDL